MMKDLEAKEGEDKKERSILEKLLEVSQKRQEEARVTTQRLSEVLRTVGVTFQQQQQHNNTKLHQ